MRLAVCISALVGSAGIASATGPIAFEWLGPETPPADLLLADDPFANTFLTINRSGTALVRLSGEAFRTTVVEQATRPDDIGLRYFASPTSAGADPIGLLGLDPAGVLAGDGDTIRVFPTGLTPSGDIFGIAARLQIIDGSPLTSGAVGFVVDPFDPNDVRYFFSPNGPVLGIETVTDSGFAVGSDEFGPLRWRPDGAASTLSVVGLDLGDAGLSPRDPPIVRFLDESGRAFGSVLIVEAIGGGLFRLDSLRAVMWPTEGSPMALPLSLSPFAGGIAYFAARNDTVLATQARNFLLPTTDVFAIAPDGVSVIAVPQPPDDAIDLSGFGRQFPLDRLGRFVANTQTFFVRIGTAFEGTAYYHDLARGFVPLTELLDKAPAAEGWVQPMVDGPIVDNVVYGTAVAGVHIGDRVVSYRRAFRVTLNFNAADTAAPFGQLDSADLTRFVTLFTEAGPGADLAEPFGQIDIADVVAFLQAFGEGY